MVNNNVVGVELGSATWWRGFHLGYAGFGCLVRISGVKTPISLPRSLHFTTNKSGVLHLFDFLALSLRVNFSSVGKKSLLSATTKLKLFSFFFVFLQSLVTLVCIDFIVKIPINTYRQIPNQGLEAFMNGCHLL
jgi:predicted MPP superfamily phosphohydrolase